MLLIIKDICRYIKFSKVVLCSCFGFLHWSSVKIFWHFWFRKCFGYLSQNITYCMLRFQKWFWVFKLIYCDLYFGVCGIFWLGNYLGSLSQQIIVDILSFLKLFDIDVLGFQINLLCKHFGIFWLGNCLGCFPSKLGHNIPSSGHTGAAASHFLFRLIG